MRGSPANPGAHDFVPANPGLIQRALKMGAIFAENHDFGSGLHSHVSWFKKGGKLGGGRVKPGKTKPKLSKSTLLNRGVTRSVARGEGGITGYERDIQLLEREYDQADRRFGLSDEVFIIENEDGSTTVDTAAVEQRARELDALTQKREQIKRKIQEYRRAIGGLIRTLTKAISSLKRALKAAGGKSRGKERAGYREAIGTYTERIGELREAHGDLGGDIIDQSIDLQELAQERAELGTFKDTAAPAADAASDLGAPAEAAPAPPSAADIAAAARAQFENFTAARADLFRTFGSNTIEAGSNPYSGTTAQAAGAGYFGATGGVIAPDARAYAAPGGSAIFVERAEFNANYPATPPDGGSYIQQQQREAALAFG